MNKGLIKQYLIGIILVVLMGSMPQGREYFREKLEIAAPHIKEAIQITYDTTNNAVLPLIGKIIKKPTLLINGKQQKVDTAATWSLQHGQSLTGEQIDSILRDIGSPAVSTGDIWISLGSEHNIDAAYALAIFIQESGAATNKAWNGWKPDGTHTYNVGNIICAGFDHNHDGVLDCYNGFRDYSGMSGNHWYNGIEGTIANLAYYRDKNNIKTYDQAIKVWAPPTENNTSGYINATQQLIQGWRITNNTVLTTNAKAISAPITTEGDFGFNVLAALKANNGALQDVSIANGEQWSFNATMGNPDDMGKLNTIGGQYGGGWCDLACRYVQVFKGLGLTIRHVDGTEALPTDGDIVFIQHGGIALYSCGIDESPFIWSNGKAGFSKGMQDLIINNNTGKTIHVSAVMNDKLVTIIGNLE